MHLKTVVTVGNIGSDADEFKVDEITKSVDIDDAGPGSDAGSDVLAKAARSLTAYS